MSKVEYRNWYTTRANNRRRFTVATTGLLYTTALFIDYASYDYQHYHHHIFQSLSQRFHRRKNGAVKTHDFSYIFFVLKLLREPITTPTTTKITCPMMGAQEPHPWAVFTYLRRQHRTPTAHTLHSRITTIVLAEMCPSRLIGETPISYIRRKKS